MSLKAFLKEEIKPYILVAIGTIVSFAITSAIILDTCKGTKYLCRG